MTEAPERIWACMSGPMVGLFVSGGNNGGWPEYVRADIAEAAVMAERERCAKLADRVSIIAHAYCSDRAKARGETADEIASAIRNQGEKK